MSILLIMKMTKIKVPKMITLLAHTDWQFEKNQIFLVFPCTGLFQFITLSTKDQFFLFLFIFLDQFFLNVILFTQKILYSVQILSFSYH